jgi:hypothetical protein
MTEDEVMKIKDRHSEQLLNIPGVHGVGVGGDEQGRPNLVILCELDKYPGLAAELPKEIEGCPVKLVKGGPIYPLRAQGT